VTSAFLFGPIAPNTTAARPYSYVDHLRVLDRQAELEDPVVDFEPFFSASAQLACGIAEADGAGLILREEGIVTSRDNLDVTSRAI